MRRDPMHGHVIRKALVRSRIKLRVLFALLDLEVASVAELAREARTKPEHVRGALFGDGEAFRASTGLARLRLVQVRETSTGDVVRLTRQGERVARAWRREVGRAALGLPRRPHA